MSPLTFTLLLTLLSLSQANDEISSKYLSALEKLENFIKEKWNNFIDDLHKAGEYLKTFWNNLLHKKYSELNDSIHNTKDEKGQLAQHCQENITDHLEKVKQDHIAIFTECSNITDAAEDVREILLKSFELTENITDSVDDLLQMTFDCKSFNPFKFVSCSFKVIGKLKYHLINDLANVKNYLKKVRILIKEINENIDSCFYPVKQNLTESLKQILKSC